MESNEANSEMLFRIPLTERASYLFPFQTHDPSGNRAVFHPNRLVQEEVTVKHQAVDFR